MDAAIPRELASRIAATAAGIEGVRSAVVCSAEGDVLGAARSEEPSKDAALASFVAVRAEALPGMATSAGWASNSRGALSAT